MNRTSVRNPSLRNALKHVPGLAPAYRAVRARWSLLRATALPSRRRERVAAVWAEVANRRKAHTSGRPTEWLSSPLVLTDYVFPQFGGPHWYAYLRERCRPIPRQRGLSLCCGDGLVERSLLKSGICAACEGVDISPEAIAACEREGDSAGLKALTYRVADVERLRLPPDSFDLAVGWMGLHHVRGLRRLVLEVKRALRPGGILVVNEYVGPPRFQMSSSQVDLINEWLGKLPERLRVTVPGDVRQSFRPPSAAEVIARDPSEALHPDQILPLVRRNFTILEQTDYGGGLLHWLLYEILQNFDPDSDEDRGWLKRLYSAERDAMARGELRSDFAFVVAQKPERG